MPSFKPYNNKRYQPKSFSNRAQARSYPGRYANNRPQIIRPSTTRRRKNYTKGYYPQSRSGNLVYVEEPETESEVEESYESGSDDSEVSEEEAYYVPESDEDAYEFNLNYNDSDDDHVDYLVDSSDDGFNVIDMNDELENDVVDAFDSQGDVIDLNDELVRLYDSESDFEDSDIDIDSESELDSESESESESDSDSESESESDSDSDSESESESEAEDILDVVDLNDQLQAQALYDVLNSVDENDIEVSTDDESLTDLEIDYDNKELDDQLALESIRQDFDEALNSEDEVSFSDASDDYLIDTDGDEFIELDSDYESSDDEDLNQKLIDAGDANNYDYSDYSSDSSDDEGVTIYKHRFDLPDSYESDNDSTDEELIYNPDDDLLRAQDSDDEVEIVDLSNDLANSKDCEIVENDDFYKLNLRFPSLIKDELKIDFKKAENELVINGKFDINLEDDDEDEDEVFEDAEEEEPKSQEEQEEQEQEQNDDIEIDNEEKAENSSESESDSESESSSSESSDSESESSSSESSDSESESSESDSESSDDEEEIEEDADALIKDYANHEIKFEKKFQFDKLVKHDEITAFFLENGELELIVPKIADSTFNKDDNVVAVSINNIDKDDETTTDEIEPAKESKASQSEDVPMEN
ncbi:hypothetical protein HYPBUDRAFT_151801 [Hyphopichia burtonii NRRL Y-1933]|uniref:SHSP domain-containing protein n=1 Tax=Hyphopichia burtonii NRRL Y-1933 TaxID=984485 RepID=A0A1E4RTC7_9ASCO|nr:hypothetical protein HYPBUDRAFT_151801 [Hyphopichia burtonii NRRL Y-1933]ODV70506.1 hypothetical protein HYPBUDRAFT_151801 [Hyphopichia burtonii NRRL Y-1933]